jgi:hypothetical protein
LQLPAAAGGSGGRGKGGAGGRGGGRAAPAGPRAGVWGVLPPPPPPPPPFYRMGPVCFFHGDSDSCGHAPTSCGHAPALPSPVPPQAYSPGCRRAAVLRRRLSRSNSDSVSGSGSARRQRAACPSGRPVRPEQQQRTELLGQAPHTAAKMNTEGQQPWSSSLAVAGLAQQLRAVALYKHPAPVLGHAASHAQRTRAPGAPYVRPPPAAGGALGRVFSISPRKMKN